MTVEPLPARFTFLAGTAGGSARRRADHLHPDQTSRSGAGPLDDLLGPVTPAASPDAACWERGAAGEELTACLLAPLSDLGWTVLHDRRLPGTCANIDHLAITGGVVFVVDTKAWRGEPKLLGDGHLWYGRTRLDDVVAGVRWQASEVADRLEHRLHQPVDVQPVLCLHGPRFPAQPLLFGDVAVVIGASLLAFLLATAASSPASHTAGAGDAAGDLFPIR